MNSLKEWVLEYLIKKGGPSAIRGAILALLGWLAARQGLLNGFGVSLDQASQTLTVHLDQLNLALVATLPALAAAVIKIVNAHAADLVTPKTDKPV